MLEKVNDPENAAPGASDPLAAVRATLFDVAPGGDDREVQVAVYVYEAPLRAWHWFNAGCLVVLAGTGYLIGVVPPSLSGEASSHFVFGYVRFLHFAAGLSLAVAFAGRIVFALTGNRYARELFFVPIRQREWWDNLWATLRWYLFLAPNARRFVGHNALAQLAMFAGFLLPLMFMIVSGLALYGEGLGVDHPLYGLSERVIAIVGGSLQLHALHRLGMWVLASFAMVHVYVAIREEIMGPQSMISTMVSGWRMFKGRP